MRKRWTSEVGDGKYRLSYTNGQLIGIEIWPEKEDPDGTQAYLVFRFTYRPLVRLRDCLAFWRRNAPVDE